MSAALRMMRRADLPTVQVLERELFGPEAWSPGMLRAELDATDTRRYVVAIDADVPDEVLGYAGLATYPDEAHVLTVGVRADRRRQGLARLMLRDLIATAEASLVLRMVLEVRADDQGARQLYESEGFEAAGLRRGYYRGGVDALVMVRPTGQSAFGQSAFGQSASGQSASGQSASGESSPGESSPGEGESTGD